MDYFIAQQMRMGTRHVQVPCGTKQDFNNGSDGTLNWVLLQERSRKLEGNKSRK